METPTVTHKTALEWNKLLKHGVKVIEPDGFDDIEWNSYLMDKEEYEHRFYQSFVLMPLDRQIWEEE